MTKILAGILLILLVILTGEGIVYWQLKTKVSKPIPITTVKPAAEAIKYVEIAGLALIGNLNLVDIDKNQAEFWAKQKGIQTVKAYAGSLPTLPAEIATLSAGQKTERPTETAILAGFFRSATGSAITVKNAGQKLAVNLNPNSRLWLKEKDKLQIVGGQIYDLVGSGQFTQIFKPDDLLLFPGITQTAGQYNASGVMIFR